MANKEKFHQMVARVAASPKAHPALKKAQQAYMKNAGLVSPKIAKPAPQKSSASISDAE